MKQLKIRNANQLRTLREKLEARRKSVRNWIVVSSGTCGQARGSKEFIAALRRSLERHGLTGKVGVRVTGCIGFCETEPNLVLTPRNIFYRKLKPEDAEAIVTETVIGGRVIDRLLYADSRTARKYQRIDEIPFYARQYRLVSGDNLFMEPTSISDYIAHGGYAALAKALTGMKPEKVIDEIKKSGLRGRGGAGFPTGLKWETCRKAEAQASSTSPAEKYIICNADEGDPGAYMDRSLLEGNPNAIIEGMVIGAYAIGATRGYIYCRTEYPLAIRNVTAGLKQARELGLLGRDILGTGFDFDIQVARGAGAFVCGEETALIASIEGKPGIPRQRPPFPAEKGLFGKPTNINNVETWATVPIVIRMGSARYSAIGTATSKGTKIFSLVGKVNNTGLVEVPMGMALKEIVYDAGGGVPKRRQLKAVQTGGPSGGCIPRELMDLSIDYEGLKQAGAMMGSGGMIVMDENTCMVDVAKYFMGFLRDESCGKCTSCREGTQRMWEILDRITRGRGTETDLALLEELAGVVKDASMCGLGQTAANPVLSTLKYFRPEFEAHIRRKECPACVCQQIVSSPCQHACPISTEAPQYIGAIARGEFVRAYDLITKDNPLLSVCGRVCNHPCEQKCRAGQSGDAIAIRDLKRFVADFGHGHQIPVYAPKPTGDQVAIIGSGPSGLMAAWHLALKGFRPTIFEAMPMAGGMLVAAIPEFRLPLRELGRDIHRIVDAGVDIKLNQRLGRDFKLDDLFQQGFKAVYLAIGAHQSLKLGIPHEDAQGVIPAMKFLSEYHLTGKTGAGKRVAVVGGGNSAIDAARVARRLPGVEQVMLLYRRTRGEMPAFEEEVEDAVAEGIVMHYLTAPVSVVRKNKRVAGVVCQRMKLGDLDQDGRRRPVPAPGSRFTLEVDTLIPAISEQPDPDGLRNANLKLSRWNTIEVDSETFATGRPGVFAGGDAIRGPSSVIEAMGDGKRAAAAITHYLRGEEMKPAYEVTRPSVYVDPVVLSESDAVDMTRQTTMRLTPEQCLPNFREVDLGLDELSAVREARRCLRCDLEARKEDEKELKKHEAV